MRFVRYFGATLLILTGLFYSCDNTGDCTDADPVEKLNVRFVKRTSLSNAALKDTQITFQKIEALHADSVFYAKGAKLSAVALAFDPRADSTYFVFDYSTDTKPKKFTIAMKYRRQFRLLSTKSQCPPRVEFSQFQLIEQADAPKKPDSLIILSNANYLQVFIAD